MRLAAGLDMGYTGKAQRARKGLYIAPGGLDTGHQPRNQPVQRRRIAKDRHRPLLAQQPDKLRLEVQERLLMVLEEADGEKEILRSRVCRRSQP